MLDVPVHLALVRAWHSIDDPHFGLSAYFALRLRPSPYLLYYTLVNVAMHAFQIETANKLVLSIYAIAFPIALAVCARSLGRSKWLGFGAFALIFNPCWVYGYVSYLLSTAAFLFSLAALLVWLTQHRKLMLGLFSFGALVTYFGHVLPWAWLVGATVAIGTCEPWVRRSKIEKSASCSSRLWAIAALLPSVLFAVWTLWDERVSRAYVGTEPFRGTWRDPFHAFLELPKRALDIFPGTLDSVVLLVLVITTLSMLARYGDEGARRLILVLWVGLGMWLILPYEISKPVIFFQISGRLPPLLLALTLLLPDVPQDRAPLAPMAAIGSAALVLCVRLTTLSIDFDRRNKPFFDLVDPLPDGSSTLVVVRKMMVGEHPEEASGDRATSAPVYWGFAEWPMALHGGFAPYVFDQGFPVRLTHKISAPPFPPPEDLLPAQAPGFDYYVIRNPTDAQRLDAGWHVQRAAGEWTLFANP
jgi:hypothetical protein